jgi:hypothetical protein
MNESNTCRIPPPSALRYFRAYVINSLLPANTEPIGAAKPFDKHTLNNDIHWPAIDIVVWYGMVWDDNTSVPNRVSLLNQCFHGYTKCNSSIR